MLEKFEPKHWIAIIIIVFGFTLIALGNDSYLTAIITLVVGYFFGSERRTQRMVLENGKQNNKTDLQSIQKGILRNN